MTSPHEADQNGRIRQLWICSKLLWAGWSQLQRMLWRDRTCSYLAHCELESISVGVVTIFKVDVRTGALEEAKPSTQQGFIADRPVGPSATTDSGFESGAGKRAACMQAAVLFFLVFSSSWSFLSPLLPLLPLPSSSSSLPCSLSSCLLCF